MTKALMNLREVYRAYGEDSETGARARQLLEQQHWYSSVAEFDPKTGDALPLGFDTVLRRQADLHRQANGPETTSVRDRLWRIVDHSRASVDRIFGSLSESPRREQAILPIRDVKELNATSFIALNRRPGRNVREKLAGRPYMQAVRRYQSVDLPQNRLVKEFVTQLADRLEFRKTHLRHEDELLGTIYRWLRSDEAQAISRWDNLPPNNTLLSHRDYRRVWDAWRRLQALDDAIDSDFQQLEARAATVEEWTGYGEAYSCGQTLFGDMPVFFDYDHFTITPWLDPIREPTPFVDRTVGGSPTASAAACVDLAYLRPRYAVHGSQERASTLPEAFLWQRWTAADEGGRESVDLELFDADVAVLHPDSTSVSSADLFFATDADESLLDWAAHAFARRLSRTFTNPVLLWLVPDFLNDFQLQVMRRNINTRFSGAEPLPRSVAAVFEQIDYSAIEDDGFQVLVVDSAGGTTYATKLIASHDAGLQERVPETRGFYWERSPHVAIGRDEAAWNPLTEIPYIDRDAHWNDAVPVRRPVPVEEKALRNHPEIGEFDRCITLSASPVSGGIRLHDLQQRAGDIPLWRDHIPELSVKLLVNGRYQRFYLVDKETRIRPRRGVAVSIPVNKYFDLPPGVAVPEFPLFQGRDPDDLGYVARLESPSFPLPTDVRCRLEMTYTYGADDPYRLIFEPLDNSFKPVQVKWRPKTEEVGNAPAPKYPLPATWAELQLHRKAGKGKASGLPDRAIRTTKELVGKFRALEEISSGTVTSDWKDRGNGYFTFAEGGYERDIYIRERDLAGGESRDTIFVGDDVYFVVNEGNGRPRAEFVATSASAVSTAIFRDAYEFIQRSLRFPYIKIWSDGRSLADSECPDSFRRDMSELLPQLARVVQAADTTPAVQAELRFLFACIHKDMPRSVSMRFAAGEDFSGDARALGFALGDLSQPWQQEILRKRLLRVDPATLTVFARAIWRNEGFVHALGAADVEKVARRTLDAIKKFNHKNSFARRDVTPFTEHCELLLGLLRSRESDDPEIRELLQPNQAITKEIAEHVEQAAASLAGASVQLKSRVQVADLPKKPAGEKTPDLLYALRLYLTGDVEAYAIRVTDVSDHEDY
jgi:hypothetical protein